MEQALGKKPLPEESAAAAKLIDELRQPLAAASNYAGAAILLLHSSEIEEQCRAVCLLEKATQQILRAGEIARRLDEALA